MSAQEHTRYKDRPPQQRQHTYGKERAIDDFDCLSDALLRQQDESLSDAAERTLRRYKLRQPIRGTALDRRRHVAEIVLRKAVDPWIGIREAAEWWRANVTR